jgi:capsular polysaccharide transport system permease protein
MLPTAPGNLSFARAYAMRSWQQEVMRMEDPLRLHLGIALSLRDTRQEFDSSQQAEARYSLLGEEAPSVLVLNGEIASLERQVAEERAKLGKDEDTTARGRQTLGGSVLSALERTRVEADRRRRYLAALVGQTLPEEALYPRRIAGSISEFAVALVLWAPGILIVYAIRDYAL